MYWRLNNLPELQHLSDNDRARLVRSSTGRLFGVRLVMHCLALALVCSLAITMVLHALIKGLLGDPATQALFVVYPVLLLALAIGFYQFVLIRVRGQLRGYLEELRSLGIELPVCVKCGYAVHDNHSGQCPECGEEL